MNVTIDNGFVIVDGGRGPKGDDGISSGKPWVKLNDTNATPLVTDHIIHNGKATIADTFILELRSDRVQANSPLNLGTSYPVDGTGVINGSMFKGVDGALYYKGGAGTITKIANN